VNNCLSCGNQTKKFGKFKTQSGLVQRYRCLNKACGRTFNETKRFADLCLDENKIIQIVHCLTEGVGVRGTARLCSCDKNTVLDVLRTIGEKAAKFHDKIVRNVITDSLQLDELWARVGTKQAKAGFHDPLRGDFYTFLGIDRASKLIVSHLTGRRNTDNTEAFVEDLSKRVFGIVQITCDGWTPYIAAIERHLTYRANLATLIKQYGTQGADINTIDPIRRYSAPQCTGIKVEIRSGEPDTDKICTSHVERLNLSVRHFNKRFARLGLGFSRKLANHHHAVALFVVAYNFCKRHSTLGTTPAVKSNLTDHCWTVAELVKNLSATI
jgi:IS1 family transposase/transposase-like protein